MVHSCHQSLVNVKKKHELDIIIKPFSHDLDKSHYADMIIF